MSETKTDKEFPKKESLLKTKLGEELTLLSSRQQDYDELVKEYNKFRDVLQKQEWNQLDRAIMDFSKSIGAYGLTDGEWKFIITAGLKDILKQFDHKMFNLEDKIKQKLKI